MKALNNYIPEFGNCAGITLKSSLLVIPAALLGISLVINSCDSIQTVGLHESLEVIPAVSLIEGARNSTITVNKGTESYFQLEIANIMPNEHIQTGLAKGWCMVWNKPIASDNAVHDGIRLYSSYGDNSLKPVNYLLNIRESLMADDQALTYREIQVAIWSLLHYPEFDLNKIRVDQLPSDMVSNGRFNFDRKKVEQIVKLVRNNVDSFRYNRASAYAVVAETPSDTQTIIIEVGETVWAYGQYSFRNQALREQLGITGDGKGQWGWIYEFDSSLSSASTELIAGGGNDDGTLPADQVGTIIGSLDIAKNGTSLRVTYDALPEYLLGDLLLWMGCSVEDFPWVGQTGNIAPGGFPYGYDDPANRYTFTVDIASLNCTENIFIAAHAGDLFRIEDITIPDEPVLAFEMIDLSQFGLTFAMDINDHGHIIGSGKYWDSENNAIITMPITGRAMNNNGQVVDWNYLWDRNNGLTEITYCCPPENDILHINAYDINNFGTVTGEIEWAEFEFEDEEFGPVYEYEWFGFTWNIGQNANFIWIGYSTAWGINDNGNVVGTFAGGSFIDYYEIQTPSNIYIDAYAINNNNQVVGRADVSSSISALSGLSDSKSNDKRSLMRKLLSATNSQGIYDYNHVIEMLNNSTFIKKAFPWESINSSDNKQGNSRSIISNTDKDIDDLILSIGTTNAWNVQAFIWDEQDGVQLLGNLGGQWATAWDINDHGQVVGYSDIGGDEYRAFYWDEEFGMIELPTFGGNSYARAINKKGQIVGYSYDDTGNFYPVQWNVTFE